MPVDAVPETQEIILGKDVAIYERTDNRAYITQQKLIKGQRITLGPPQSLEFGDWKPFVRVLGQDEKYKCEIFVLQADLPKEHQPTLAELVTKLVFRFRVISAARTSGRMSEDDTRLLQSIEGLLGKPAAPATSE